MSYARALHRRLAKLEAVAIVLSTEEKWNSIHRRALKLMSDYDLRILEEMAVLRNAGQEIQQTHEQKGATARYDEACMAAIAEQSVRFTIPEMDQVLAAK